MIGLKETFCAGETRDLVRDLAHNIARDLTHDLAHARSENFQSHHVLDHLLDHLPDHVLGHVLQHVLLQRNKFCPSHVYGIGHFPRKKNGWRLTFPCAEIWIIDDQIQKSMEKRTRFEQNLIFLLRKCKNLCC